MSYEPTASPSPFSNFAFKSFFQTINWSLFQLEYKFGCATKIIQRIWYLVVGVSFTSHATYTESIFPYYMYNFIQFISSQVDNGTRGRRRWNERANLLHNKHQPPLFHKFFHIRCRAGGRLYLLGNETAVESLMGDPRSYLIHYFVSFVFAFFPTANFSLFFLLFCCEIKLNETLKFLLW